MEPTPQDTDGATRAVQQHKPNTLKLFIAGISGVLASLLLRVVTAKLAPSQSVLQPIPDEGGSAFLQLNYRFLHAINSVYVVLPFFLVCVLAAVSRRNHPHAWLLAFLAGYVFPFIALHWILGWI